MGEDSVLELKAVEFSGNKVVGPHKDGMADELAAMANIATGVIVLGVDDKTREIRRAIPPEKLDFVEGWLRSICNDSIDPPLSADNTLRRRATATAPGMHLSDHDLRQLDEAYLDGLTPEQARGLLGRAMADLKAARERLNPSRRSAISGEMAARPLSTRDRAARVTPSCRATSVTVSPSAGSTSSRSVSPGWGGL